MIAIIFSISKSCIAQVKSNNPITTIDVIKVKDGLYEEASFYYTNNWKTFRDSATVKGFITSFSMIKPKKDSTSSADYILITTYKDSINYERSEVYFKEFMLRQRPNGFIRLNNIMPKDFRVIINSYTGEEYHF